MASTPIGATGVSTPTDDVKLKQLLKELFQSLRQVQEEQARGEHTLSNIKKAHAKIQQEQKVTTYYRNKLKTLYSGAKEDAHTEEELLRKALSQIDEIISMRGGLGGDARRQVKRRGVLMHLLRTSATLLPLWIGPANETAPPLCGAIPAESTFIARPGDKVAARVKSPQEDMTEAGSGGGGGGDIRPRDDFEDEENWILAEVVSFNGNSAKYDVDDVDADEGKGRHVLSRRKVVPLPTWKANPDTHPEALFELNTLVLALYPQTTCFYRGVVQSLPTTALDNYEVKFEDNQYPDGYSPPMPVPQLYVVPCKDGGGGGSDRRK